jgi:hypothetical protein
MALLREAGFARMQPPTGGSTHGKLPQHKIRVCFVRRIFTRIN